MRLETALSSDTNQVEDRFEGTTVVDLRENGRVLIPAGSRVRGVVTGVREAGRVDRKGSLTLSFDQITINGRTHPIRGSVTEALESGGYKEDAGKIGDRRGGGRHPRRHPRRREGRRRRHPDRRRRSRRGD